MSTVDYSREAFRRARERKAAQREPARLGSLLADIPADAPMDDATITAWTGERFMDYDKWRAIRPVATEDPQDGSKTKADAKAARAKAPAQEGLWEEE
jgi:hypothetical protein